MDIKLILRGDKQAPLTVEEMDRNLVVLKEAITDLEREMRGALLREGGEVLDKEAPTAQVEKMPLGSLRLKGPWKPKKKYDLGNIVFYQNQLWCCLNPHESPWDFQEYQQGELHMLEEGGNEEVYVEKEEEAEEFKVILWKCLGMRPSITDSSEDKDVIGSKEKSKRTNKGTPPSHNVTNKRLHSFDEAI